MQLDYAQIIKRLEKPTGMVDAVLDTDTFNEVDDQYALAYLIQSKEKIRLQAVYAAPFHNHHSEGPEDGMERSYREIFHVYDLMGETRYHDVTFRGAVSFLPDEKTPVDSQAVRDLVERSKAYTMEKPLYVIAIAAATNIASALLIDPSISQRIVVLWHGGLSYDWHDNRSFNCGQDVAAARVLMDSGVPVVQFPGRGVTDFFYTTGPELEHWLRGKNQFCDYMIDITAKEAEICYGGKVWSRCLFDVVPVAWLLDQDYVFDRLEHAPVMQDTHYYSVDKRRHFIKYVYGVKRDDLMNDLFEKLAKIPL